MVLMRSIMLALTGVKIVFSKFVPIVANDTVHSTNGVIGCQKKQQNTTTTFKFMLLTLVLFANDDYVIDRTVSSSISNKVND